MPRLMSNDANTPRAVAPWLTETLGGLPELKRDLLLRAAEERVSVSEAIGRGAWP